jgi:ABC-2 type transport system permease protein
MGAFWQLVRTDLRLYFSNRRALIMNLAAPIVIAAFFGSLFGPNRDGPPATIPIAVSDQDGSTLSKAIARQLAADKRLAVRELEEAAAVELVRSGKLQADIVFPQGFGANAGLAMFGAAEKVPLAVHYDPSQYTTLQLVDGLLAQAVMQEVGQSVFSFSGDTFTQLHSRLRDNTTMSAATRKDLGEILDRADRLQARTAPDPAPGAVPGPAQQQRGLGLPYTLKEDEVRAQTGVPYNSYAHSFAGMGVQFVLMMGVELGVGLLMMRRLGLWRRIRAAPLGKGMVLGARVVMAALASLGVMFVLYAVAMGVFGVRVQGSWPGFFGVLLAFSLMTASLGLLIASLGGTPEATRGLAIFLTLILVMLGGAWIPTFIFPAWLQKITVFVPTRWAVDGLDAMTWRGQGIAAAGMPILGMCACAALCLVAANWLFKWEE